MMEVSEKEGFFFNRPVQTYYIYSNDNISNKIIPKKHVFEWYVNLHSSLNVPEAGQNYFMILTDTVEAGTIMEELEKHKVK